jgi:GDP-mannose 6-dehydrogenase
MAMRIACFGLGYVGCVTSACLAQAGHHVVGVDVNAEKVKLVNAGVSPLVEPGLDELIAEVVGTGRLTATGFAEEAVSATGVALVCVGTPCRANGQLDVRALTRVIEEIGAALRGAARSYTVVIRSTVLPGTIERLIVPALHRPGAPDGPHIRVAANPEFLREGSALRDFANPPFTLVGADDAETATLLRDLYRCISAPFVATTVRTAEFVKYAANAFHALKITFANEIGDLCEAFGVDPGEVMRIFVMDRKLNVSEAYLRPGFAFGGSCLPKDLRALLHAARSLDVSAPVLTAILPSNETQIRHGIDAVLGTHKRKVGVVGLAFKRGTDDLRESPMVTLVEALIGKGCDVRVLDPYVSIGWLVGANRRHIEEEIPHIASLMCKDVDALLDHAEVLVIGSDCEEARMAIRAAGPDRVVVDLMRANARSASADAAE